MTTLRIAGAGLAGLVSWGRAKGRLCALAPVPRPARLGRGARVIFLDVDGVLNTRRTLRRHGTPEAWEPALVARLHSLVAQTGAESMSTECRQAHSQFTARLQAALSAA